jgi:uncharacterized membrane protein YdbT with pleckstrin-like domain
VGVSEIDEGLITGETVVTRTQKHWLAPIADSKWAILMLIGVALLAWIEPTNPDGILTFVWRIVDLIQLGLFLGAIGWIVYNVVAWQTAEFAVTTMRVRGHDGLIKKRSTDSLLSSITDVQSKSSAIGRSLGFGNIRIMTGSGSAGEDTFTSMKGPDAFKKAILEQKSSLDTRAPAPAAAAPAPSVPVAGPAPAPMDQLSQLAALRDSGAITPAEYEAKKAELLARI